MSALGKFLKNIGTALFIIILILTFASVFFRYILNDSIVWAEEVIRYTFIWMFFLCMPEATRIGAHITLDIFPSRLKGKNKTIVNILIEIINIAFLAIVVFYGMKITIVNMAQSSAALRIPYGFVYLAIPVGGSLMLFFTVYRIYCIIKNKTVEG